MRFSRGWALLIVVAMAAFVLTDAANRVIDALFFPWAFADPPLLAGWSGTLTAGNGDRLTMTLALERDYTNRDEVCVRCNQIKGSATTCDAQGRIRRYRISGSPRDRQARQLHLGASPEPDPPPDGLELDTLIGQWDGADTLTLDADFHWRKGKSAISSTDDPATQPVPVRLTRRTRDTVASPCA